MFKENNLFLELIVDKDARRQIAILKRLSSEDWLLIQDLVRSLKVNKKTIQADIEAIKRKCNTVEIKVSKEGICNTDNSEKEIQNAILIIVNKTLSYRIIENYFRSSDIIKLEHMAATLFASFSAIKKRIFHINSIIKTRFGCAFSTYKNELVGSEANIRYFFFTYYSELQDVFNVSEFQDKDVHQIIFKTLQEEIIKRKLKKLNYSYFQLRQWLFVAKIRIQNGHIINIKKKQIEEIVTHQSYEDFDLVYREIMGKHFGLNALSEDEVLWSYINILDAITYSTNFPELDMARKEINLEIIKQDNFKVIDDVIKTLALKEVDRDAFFEIFNCFFENATMLNIVSTIYQTVTPQTKEFVLMNFRHQYCTWYNAMENNGLFKKMKIVFKSDMCCKLALITSQFIYATKKSSKRVLFSFTGEAGMVSYLESMTRDIFQEKCQIIFNFNELLSEELIEKTKPDVVVCNYNNIENLKCNQLIRISSIPDMRNWTI